MKVKAVVAAFPDHSAPKALISCKQEKGGFISVGQMTAAFSPVCPSSPVGIGQEKSSFFIIELLKHSPSELRTHSVCKTVSYKLIQFQCACFDPLFQADAFTQAARMLTVIVLTVFAPGIIGRIMKRAAVYPTASRFLAGLRHHQLFHCLQRRISHEIAWHK